VKGRPISEQDTATSPHVAVINEAFARKFFKNENPIGKHFGRTELRAAGEYEIVGVAKDARYLPYEMQKPIGPFFFMPESQFSVFSKPSFEMSEARTHYLHDVVVRMQPGVQ
jgi:hypothetical protein